MSAGGAARGRLSLRQRLLVSVLAPLLVVAVILGAGRAWETWRMTEDLFDRTLLSAALAVSRDYQVQTGEALSGEMLGLLAETSGGRLFYHLQGPDGAFVTGYATPPLPTGPVPEAAIAYFDGHYRGDPVRVVRLRETVDLGWVSGEATTTAWQTMSARRGFALSQVAQTGALVAGIVLSAAILSWFGLRQALRPLTALEAAIGRRSPDDLTPIRRPVPEEVRGVIATLNALFDRVSRRISSKDQFISNAAHQLRNPIAGVLSLAEAIHRRAREPELRGRAEEMVAATRHAQRLADQLLSWERLQDEEATRVAEVADLTEIAARATSRVAARILRGGADLSFDRGPPVHVRCDPALMEEAIVNLIDNAAVHGGRPDVSITVETFADGQGHGVRVRDDGVGLRPEDRPAAVNRFSQVRPGAGSGLGLSIADAILRRAGGTLEIEAVARGASVVLVLPARAPGGTGEVSANV
ncbi:MAG: sensor histidine kinase [Pseudomonadota bacterium]